MKPPIILGPETDILFFKSVKEAERYMEPIDVKSGEYPFVYDSEGYLLVPEVVSREVRSLFGIIKTTVECVSIRKVEPNGKKVNKLRSVLERFISFHGAVLSGTESLERILLEALSIAGFTE